MRSRTGILPRMRRIFSTSLTTMRLCSKLPGSVRMTITRTTLSVILRARCWRARRLPMQLRSWSTGWGSPPNPSRCASNSPSRISLQTDGMRQRSWPTRCLQKIRRVCCQTARLHWRTLRKGTVSRQTRGWTKSRRCMRWTRRNCIALRYCNWTWNAMRMRKRRSRRCNISCHTMKMCCTNSGMRGLCRATRRGRRLSIENSCA
ncbi:hypothetical protein SDC9_136995 [bioreactor metagenome]|uniref:Uncharacterized protein n=1 Tax=bioreactor metagenome TaxID=1076179 RepID=A0A645DKC0_9ZZZZ